MRFWIDNGKILIIYWLNFFNYLSKIKYFDFKKTCIIWFISYHKIFKEENQIIEHLWGRENYFFFGKLTEQNLFLKYFATWRDTNGVSILFNLYLRFMKLWVENFKIVPTSVKTFTQNLLENCKFRMLQSVKLPSCYYKDLVTGLQTKDKTVKTTYNL